MATQQHRHQPQPGDLSPAFTFMTSPVRPKTPTYPEKQPWMTALLDMDATDAASTLSSKLPHPMSARAWEPEETGTVEARSNKLDSQAGDYDMIMNNYLPSKHAGEDTGAVIPIYPNSA
ncbi:uncharacterized protein RHO17_024988 [Thomomys bottae]